MWPEPELRISALCVHSGVLRHVSSCLLSENDRTGTALLMSFLYLGGREKFQRLMSTYGLEFVQPTNFFTRLPVREFVSFLYPAVTRTYFTRSSASASARTGAH